MSNTAAFLADLCRDLADDERQEIRTFHRGGARDRQPGPRRFGTDADTLATFAARLSGPLDVYYTINPRRGEDGTKAGVSRIRFIHIDLDNKHFPDGAAGAVRALADFPLPPTWVIATGGGFQVLWALAAPLVLTGPEDPQIAEVEGVTARLAAALGNLDKTHDASRVFRLPGSHNHKYPHAPEVVVRHEDLDARYTLEEFAALLPAPVTTPRPRPAPPLGDTPAGDLREMLRCIDPQPGYADWVRVLAAIHSAHPGPEGLALAEEWSGHVSKDGEIEEKFRSFGRYRGVRGPASIGTIVYLARQGGWRPPERQHVPAATPVRSTAQPAPDEIRDSSAGAPPLVVQLRARVEALERENAELRRKYARAQKTLTSVIQVRRNQHIKAERDTLMACVLDVMAERANGHADAEGWVRLPAERVAETVGKGVKATRTHMERGEEWGLLERRLVEETRPGAGRRPVYYVRTTDEPERVLDILVTLKPRRVDKATGEEKDDWGGKREPCPRCGCTERKTVCAGCGLELSDKRPDRGAPPVERPEESPVDRHAVVQTEEPASIPPTPVVVPPPPATYPQGDLTYTHAAAPVGAAVDRGVEPETDEEPDDWDPYECNMPGCTRRPMIGKRYCGQHRDGPPLPRARPAPPVPPVPPVRLSTIVDPSSPADYTGSIVERAARQRPLDYAAGGGG